MKLRFHSDFDVNLGSTVALIAIADGAKGQATETVDGTGQVGDVANYAVWTQDDQFYAMWLAKLMICLRARSPRWSAPATSGVTGRPPGR